MNAENDVLFAFFAFISGYGVASGNNYLVVFGLFGLLIEVLYRIHFQMEVDEQ